MGSRSKSTTKQTTNVTTTTTTNIRDIGFTGQQAVDMAAILEGGAIDRAQVNADTVRVMTSQLGSSFKTLMGGAGDIFREGKAEAKTELSRIIPFIALAVVGVLVLKKAR